MRNNKLWRNIGLAAIALFAIGVVGYAASNGTGGDESDALRDEGSADAVPSDGFATAGSSGGTGADAVKAGDFDDAREEAPQGESGVASAGAPASGPVAQGGSLVSAVDRKIVSTASVQLQVDDVGGSFEEVGRIATSVGGFIASSSFTYQGEDQLASVTIRVPAESYQGVLSACAG